MKTETHFDELTWLRAERGQDTAFIGALITTPFTLRSRDWHSYSQAMPDSGSAGGEGPSVTSTMCHVEGPGAAGGYGEGAEMRTHRPRPGEVGL